MSYPFDPTKIDPRTNRPVNFFDPASVAAWRAPRKELNQEETTELLLNTSFGLPVGRGKNFNGETVIKWTFRDAGDFPESQITSPELTFGKGSKQWIRGFMDRVSNDFGVEFEEVPAEEAELNIMKVDGYVRAPYRLNAVAGMYTSPLLPHEQENIWIGNLPGVTNFRNTFVHEVGHVLNLNDISRKTRDIVSKDNSWMAYGKPSKGHGWGQYFQPSDIDALTEMYGPDDKTTLEEHRHAQARAEAMSKHRDKDTIDIWDVEDGLAPFMARGMNRYQAQDELVDWKARNSNNRELRVLARLEDRYETAWEAGNFDRCDKITGQISELTGVDSLDAADLFEGSSVSVFADSTSDFIEPIESLGGENLLGSAMPDSLGNTTPDLFANASTDLYANSTPDFMATAATDVLF